MKRHTVLGARGFIGSNLVAHLDRMGLQAFTPERGSPEIFDADLGHVFYCIGLTGDFIERPIDTVEAHVCFLVSLLRHAKFSSLIYLSSTRVYDGQVGPADEDMSFVLNPADPRHIYDFSKGAGEALCHAVRDRAMTVARISSVYDNTLRAENFFHDVCRRALSERSFEIETSADAARDYIHIDDVCDALIKMSDRSKYSTYNIASGVNVSNHELIALVSEATGCRITIRDLGASRPVPRINIGRIKGEFSFAPKRLQDRIGGILSAHMSAKPKG